MSYNIIYKFGDYVLKNDYIDTTYPPGVTLGDVVIFPDVGHTWYYGDVEASTIDFGDGSIFSEEFNEIVVTANPYENINSSITSIHMANMGNIIAPNGASIIFGAETNDENAVDIIKANLETYNPYNIVIVEEEEEDEILPTADEISFSPDLTNGKLTETNVQDAILELEQIVYQTVPTFTQQVIVALGGETSFDLNINIPSDSMMVYYNGLLINLNKHFSYANKKITLLGFEAEEGDILTVIGLAASNSAVLNAIGGTY